MKNSFTRNTLLLLIIYGCIALCFSQIAFSAIPKVPLNLTALSVSPGQITVSWQDASTDETGFELEQSVDGTKFVKIADLPANSIIYQNTGLKAFTKYWYRIRSKNASGNSAYSNLANATTKAPIVTIPKAPSALVATAISGTQINLVWTDNANDETGFELERSADGINFSKLTDLAANAVNYQNTNLTPATKYWYRILAKNTAGKSAYSNVANIATLQVAPKAPENLAAVSVSTTQINLTWADKADNETGFQLERSLNGTTFTKITDLGANVTTYQNTALTPATQYYYRLRAINAVGFSAYSNVSSAKTQNIPVPNAPANFTAVPVAPDVVRLRWAPITGNATEVVIERTRDLNAAFTQIRKQPANVLQYDDKDAFETADYYYRIKAVNAGGDSPYSSIAIVRASSIITAVEPLKDSHLIYVSGRELVAELARPFTGNLLVYDQNGIARKHSVVQQSSRTDLSSLRTGLYIVVIQTDKEVISRKILLY